MLLALALALASSSCSTSVPGGGSSGGTSSSSPGPGPGPSAPPDAEAVCAPDRRPLPGFGEVVVSVAGGGSFCALLADDPATRSQGLMEQIDLRGYDGMVFAFDEPVDATFYMRNTRIPLSVAFFDAGGRFVSAADMEPCPDDVDPCPTYGADAPYVHAVEVAKGDLPRLGLVPGSRVTVTPPA